MHNFMQRFLHFLTKHKQLQKKMGNHGLFGYSQIKADNGSANLI